MPGNHKKAESRENKSRKRSPRKTPKEATVGAALSDKKRREAIIDKLREWEDKAGENVDELRDEGT